MKFIDKAMLWAHHNINVHAIPHLTKVYAQYIVYLMQHISNYF